MSDAQPELDGKVRSWLERSGYALELRVARRFTALPGSVLVQPSRPYWHRPAEKWREVDVVAYVAAPRDPRVRFQVVAECKSGKKHPWVVLSDQRRSLSDESAFDTYWRVQTSADWARRVWENGRGLLPMPNNSSGYSVIEAVFGSDSEADRDNSDTPRVPYRATMQLLSAAKALASEAPLAPGGAYAQVTLPIIVTAAPLYECHLKDDGQLELVRTQHSSLYVQPDLSNRGPILVQIMNEDYLGIWTRELASALDGMRINLGR